MKEFIDFTGNLEINTLVCNVFTNFIPTSNRSRSSKMTAVMMTILTMLKERQGAAGFGAYINKWVQNFCFD